MTTSATSHQTTSVAESLTEHSLQRRLTPMLRQYLDAKQAHPDALLMFRMGDFYELFFEDAVVAARELDLTLTARDKSNNPIPMAGVPHHAVSAYINKLVDRGYSVAICDQVEDPRQAKGLVKREITRLITPGTVIDAEGLEPGVANYLACVALVDDAGGLVVVGFLDLLAGELLYTSLRVLNLADELRRMRVREVLIPKYLQATLTTSLQSRKIALRPIDLMPSVADAQQTWSACFGGRMLPADATAAVYVALAQLIEFAQTSQKRAIQHLRFPRAYNVHDALWIDAATRRNLELEQTQIEGQKLGSLLWVIDQACTGMGSRLLHQWLLFPLRQKKLIERRLDAVQELVQHRDLRIDIQAALHLVRDIERLLGRVALGRATPRDLSALQVSLGQMPTLQNLWQQQQGTLASYWQALDVAVDVHDLLQRALVDTPPVQCQDGGIFRQGFCPELDQLIAMATQGHGYLTELEQRERARTGIQNLKVRYNRVFGYYIEVTNANLGQVPQDYIRKQTLVGAERFITPELKSYEDTVLHADERRKQRESVLFEQLLASVGANIPRLRKIATLVGQTDALASLAKVADEQRYVRPVLCEEKLIKLTAARHPVLEKLLPQGERFVPNDVHLQANNKQLLLLTGPNMAGKSTVMRQTALCVLLAHMGSFVPAQEALIGLCDRLFTRVGAADNLGRGQSTFMVEMLETAHILEQATAQSLVILDEIGRGTSTFDGVSIAWAVAEYMHENIGCCAMFATHYHELTELAQHFPRIFNASMAVQKRNDSVVFLRRLVEGAAQYSYGIEVATLAGMPAGVIARAKQILKRFEQPPIKEPTAVAAVPNTPELPPQLAAYRQALAELNLDNMTPMEALQTLAQLKATYGTPSLGHS